MSVGFQWTERREEAAMLVAKDELSNEAIAERIGISRHCLDKWKRRPEFRERVDELVAAMGEAIRGKGIADLENRVAALNERWNLMHRVIEARAVQYADVPGGDTGLLVEKKRASKRARKRAGDRGTGRHGDSRQMELWDAETRRRGDADREEGEYVVDVGLLRALLDHEKQAAQELGQWQAERETEPTVVIRGYVGVDVEKA